MEITYRIEYFESYLQYKAQIVSDEGSYYMAKIITPCSMQGRITAVYKNQIITAPPRKGLKTLFSYGKVSF